MWGVCVWNGSPSWITGCACTLWHRLGWLCNHHLPCCVLWGNCPLSSPCLDHSEKTVRWQIRFPPGSMAFLNSSEMLYWFKALKVQRKGSSDIKEMFSVPSLRQVWWHRSHPFLKLGVWISSKNLQSHAFSLSLQPCSYLLIHKSHWKQWTQFISVLH